MFLLLRQALLIKRKIVLLLIVGLLLNSLGLAQLSNTALAATSEVEPNNNQTQANKIIPGDSAFGQISYGNDVDFYKFEWNGGPGSVNVTLTDVPAGKDYGLRIYGPDGYFVPRDKEGAGKDETVDISANSNQLNKTFYIEVFGFEGAYTPYRAYRVNLGSLPQLPLADLTINSIDSNDQYITGRTEPKAYLTVIVGNAFLGGGYADNSGNYKINIAPQFSGALIKVGTSKDGFRNSVNYINVATAPELFLNNIDNNDWYLYGTTNGNSVEILKNDVSIGNAALSADGTFTYKFSSEQPTDTQFTARARDARGNDTSMTRSVLKAPTISINHVDNNDLSLSGSTNGSSVQIFKNGSSIGYASVSGGLFTYSFTNMQSVGTTFKAIARDSNGSDTSYERAVAAAPSLTANALDSNDTLLRGTISRGSIVSVTNVTTGRFLGNGAVSGETFTLGISAQAAGSTLQLTAIDSEGNDTLYKLIVNQAPDITLRNIDNNDWSLSGTTNGSTVEILKNGQRIGDAAVYYGTFTYNFTNQQTSGTKFTAIARDRSGNDTSVSTIVADAPTIFLNKIDSNDVLLSGTTSGTSVQILRDGVHVGYVLAVQGAFSFRLPNSMQAGTKIKAIARNADGNDTSMELVVAEAPTLTVEPLDSNDLTLRGMSSGFSITLRHANSGNLIGNANVNFMDGHFSMPVPSFSGGEVLRLTSTDVEGNDTTITFIVKTAPTLTINRIDDDDMVMTGTTNGTSLSIFKDNKPIGEIAPSEGAFTYPFTTPQPAGTVFTVTARDAAGSDTTASSTVVTAPRVTLNDIDNNDKIVSGTFANAITVDILKDRMPIGKAKLSGNQFSLEPFTPSPAGTVIRAVARDAFGNIASSERMILIAPLLNINKVDSDDTELTGTTDGASIQVFKNGLDIGYASVSNGKFKYEFSSLQPVGAVFKVIARGQNNRSDTSAEKVVGLAPTLSFDPVDDNDTEVRGTTSATSVEIWNAAGKLGNAKLTGKYFTYSLPSTQKAGSIVKAIATDPAGNNVIIERTVDQSPALKLSQIDDNDSEIWGTSDGVSVDLYAGTAKLKNVNVINNAFRYALASPLAIGTQIKATAYSQSGADTSQTVSVQSAPPLTLTKVDSDDLVLTGTTTGTRYTIYKNDALIGSLLDVVNGRIDYGFTTRQPAGTKFKVTVFDANQNDTSKEITVVGAPYLQVMPLASNQTLLRGTTNGTKVTVFKKEEVLGSLNQIPSDGKFQINLPSSQSNGTKLKVVAEDAQGNDTIVWVTVGLTLDYGEAPVGTPPPGTATGIACTYQDAEYNDTESGAGELLIGQQFNGGRIGCQQDRDYFYFETGTYSGGITVTMLPPAGVDFELQVYKAGTSPSLATDTSALPYDQREQVYKSVQPGERYFIKIYSSGLKYSSTEPYYLEIKTSSDEWIAGNWLSDQTPWDTSKFTDTGADWNKSQWGVDSSTGSETINAIKSYWDNQKVFLINLINGPDTGLQNWAKDRYDWENQRVYLMLLIQTGNEGEIAWANQQLSVVNLILYGSAGEQSWARDYMYWQGQRDYLSGLINDPNTDGGTKLWAQQRLDLVNKILTGTESERQYARDRLYWLDEYDFLYNMKNTSPDAGERNWANYRLYLVDKILNGSAGDREWAKKRWSLLELIEHGTPGEKAWAEEEIRRMDQPPPPPAKPRLSSTTSGFDGCSTAECRNMVKELGQSFFIKKAKEQSGLCAEMNLSFCNIISRYTPAEQNQSFEAAFSKVESRPSWSDTAWDYTKLAGYFLKGLLLGFFSPITDIIEALKNYDEILEGLKAFGGVLVDFVSDPSKEKLWAIGQVIGGAVIDEIMGVWNNFQNSNKYEKSEQIGKVLGGIVVNALLGGVGVKGITKLVGDLKYFKKLKKIDICHCFTAGTKVLTQDGEKPIEQVQIGDLVWSKNPDTGEMAYKEVDLLMQRPEDEIWKVYVGDEVISTSDEHPFWIKDKGWVVTKDLVVGDLFETSDGSHLPIGKIEVNHDPTTVYNFRVKDFHTYYVSNLKILTHNSSGKCDGKGGLHPRSQEEWDDLAKDPAQGNKISEKTEIERQIGFDLEQTGDLPGPIRRDPSGRAEFIDANGVKWDIKGFNSNFPPKNGGYRLDKVLKAIQEELDEGENVILDTTKLYPEHIKEVSDVIDNAEWRHRIKWWPKR